MQANTHTQTQTEVHSVSGSLQFKAMAEHLKEAVQPVWLVETVLNPTMLHYFSFPVGTEFDSSTLSSGSIHMANFISSHGLA